MTIAMPHNHHRWEFYPGFYVKAVVYLIVFYINYFYLVDRQLGKLKPCIWRFVMANVAVVVAAIALTTLIQVLAYDVPRSPERIGKLTQVQRIMGLMSFALRDAVMLVLAIGLAAAMRLSTHWADMQLQRQKLLSVQRTTELDSLKRQLNPHFLFNTLNSIYALIDINAENAKKSVHKLSGMLRYMLYEDALTVPLQREAEFLENYVSLMQLRLRVSDHPLEVQIVDAETAKGLTVPPLIFIPLVENALKYGIGAEPGTAVKMSLVVADGRIRCRTVNGFDPSGVKKEGGGIGLTNLRRRLLLIYGNDAELRTCIADGVYTSELSLPLTVPALQPKAGIFDEDEL